MTKEPDRTLSALVVVASLANAIDAVAMVGLPVLAMRVYESPVSLGFMTAASGAGSVAGALAFAAFGSRSSRRAVFTWGFIVVAASYPVAALYPPLGLLLAANAVAGVAAGPLNPVIDTVFIERVPVHMRGRVFGVTKAAAWLSMPFGVLAGGMIIDAVGLRGALLAGGAAYVAMTLGARSAPGLRALDRAVTSRAHEPATVSDRPP